MSLQYNILWVDDRKENYQTLEIDKELILYLKELFFEPHIYMYESVEEAEENMGQRRYDVIFSDFNIGEKKDGKDFIADIRNRNVNSEILFYSAKQTPPAMSMDRISFLRLQSDSSYEELKNKMKSVIDLTVEKLSDLTNLRGLVMAEVSELDNKMEQLISDYFIIEDEKEMKLRRDFFDKKIVKNVEESTKQKLERVDCKQKTCKHKWHNKSIQEIISSIDFESSKKALAIDLLVEKLTYDFKGGQFYDTYLNEIIFKRNDLAHSYSVIEKGEEILKTKKHGPQKFTKNDIANIRRDIKKYHLIFNDLDKLIEEKNRKITV